MELAVVVIFYVNRYKQFSKYTNKCNYNTGSSTTD